MNMDMDINLAHREETGVPVTHQAVNGKQYLSFYLGKMLFGLPLLEVQDVLVNCELSSIPLSRKEVAGTLNLRGQIVTAIDMRVLMGLQQSAGLNNGTSIVVHDQKVLYSLIVDKVGEVQGLRSEQFDPNPGNLDALWREYSDGVFRLDGELMVLLNIGNLISSVNCNASPVG